MPKNPVFYRSANATFGKIDRSVFEEVILQLVTNECIPILLDDLEACPYCHHSTLLLVVSSSNYS